MLKKMDMAIKIVEKILTNISWMVCLFVTLMIVIDVFLRFVFNHPLPATWEISEISMPFIVFLPFAYTLTIDAHVRVSLVKDRVPPKVRLGFEIFTHAISFMMCAMLTYWSWLRFWESFMISEEILAAIRLPWWLGKMAMPIGMGFFAIRYLILIFNLTSRKYSEAGDSAHPQYVTEGGL